MKARVLLIEDDPISQDLAVELLEEMGVLVDLATTAKEAHYYLDLNHYNLIFISSPLIRKTKLAQEIRDKDEGTEHRILIALLNEEDEESAEEIISNGLDDYIFKPIQIKDLHEILYEYLGGATL